MSDATPSDDEVIAAVGARLRALRASRGWTLASLAERSGVTSSTLSRLETNRVRPSLDHMLALSRAYGLPLDELVAAPRVGDPRVHLRPVQSRGFVYIPLGVHAGGLQAFKVVFPPTSGASAPTFKTHPGREWFYVVSGAVLLALGDERMVVSAGEAAEFTTETPHWLMNATADDGPAELIAIYGRQGERVHISEV